MHRRALLRATLPAIAGVLAGCTRSVNPNLEIQNRREREVELHVVLFSDLNDRGEKVTERTVTVRESSTETVKIFGDDQYEVHVTYDGLTAEFKTRPICETAETVVTIHEDGAISSDVEWCEGTGPEDVYVTPPPGETEAPDTGTVEPTPAESTNTSTMS